jgi:hypothetical protein
MNFCKTCKSRSLSGYCINHKISEDIGQEYTEDMLVYEFYENGSFWVGENFGCVHHTQKKEMG